MGVKWPCAIWTVSCSQEKCCTTLFIFHWTGTIFKDEDLMEFAQMGSYLEFDLFGGDSGYYRLRTGTVVAMPTGDFQRIDSILRLIEQGYEDKIIVAHDIHSKNRLVCSHYRKPFRDCSHVLGPGQVWRARLLPHFRQHRPFSEPPRSIRWCSR